MAYNEFREFSNPEEQDYDITSSSGYAGPSKVNNTYNPYADELMDLIGIPEDEEVELWANAGVSFEEMLNPNAATIQKVRYILDNNLLEQNPRR